MATTSGHDVDHARYEDFMLTMYLVWRGISVVVYGASTWESRARYRRPRVAALAWLLMTADIVWSTRRLLRGRHTQDASVTGWVDTAATAAIVGFLPHALEPGDADLWRGWHVSQAILHAEAIAFLLPRRSQHAAVTATLVAAHAAAQVLAPGSTDWGDVTRTGATIAFRGLWTSIFASVVRDNVKRLERAHTDAVRTAENAALQRSRSRHRRYLQGRAMTVLEAIAVAEHPRVAELRLAANREAGRLRRLLVPADGAHSELADVVDEAAARGIDLEVVYGDVPTALPHAAVDAIRAEVALTGRDASPGIVRHVVLFVDAVADTLVVTLRGNEVRREVRITL